MKRFILYFLFLHLFLPQLQAQQQQDWQWGKRGGSGNINSLSNEEHEVIGMVTDQNNNVYVLETHIKGYNLPDIDGHLGITGNDQLILASWDCAGDFRWMKSFGTANSLFPHLDNGGVGARSLGIDTLGGIYIIGGGQRGQNNGCYLYVDTDTIINYRVHQTAAIFFLKYDTSGNFQWLRRPIKDSVSRLNQIKPYIADISVMPNGDFYVYAHLTPGVYENGAFVINEIFGKNFYVIKYNKDGIFQELTHLDIYTSMDMDPNDPNFYFYHTRSADNAIQGVQFLRDHQTGKFYLTGRFQHRSPRNGKHILRFGNTEIIDHGQFGNLAASGALYVTVFDSTGNVIWAKQADTLSQFDSLHTARASYPSFDIDLDGNIYVTSGIHPYRNSWDGYAFSNSLSNSQVPFVLKIDKNGNLIWGSHASTDRNTTGSALTWSKDIIAIGGKINKDRMVWDSLTLNITSFHFYLNRLNALDGSIIDMNTVKVESHFSSAVEHLTADGQGSFYMGGGFDSWLAVAGDTLRSHRGRNWFVLKFGYEHCDCEIPEPDFTTDKINGLIYRFDFTGIPADADSIVWDWGDGTHTTITDGSSGWNASHTYSQEGLYEVCVTVHNACAIQTYCEEIKIERITNIDGLNAFPDLQFYPNPASQDLYLDKIPEGVTLDIYNTLGQHVLHRPLPAGKSVIDVSKLASGVYILEFKAEDGRKGNGRLVVGDW